MEVFLRVLSWVLPNMLISIVGSLIANRIERFVQRRAMRQKAHKEKSSNHRPR